MWIHTVRWMQLGAVLVELPAGWKRSNVPPACKGKEGEEREASRAALTKADTREQEAGAHCKGTEHAWHNKLADVAAR